MSTSISVIGRGQTRVLGLISVRDVPKLLGSCMLMCEETSGCDVGDAAGYRNENEMKWLLGLRKQRTAGDSSTEVLNIHADTVDRQIASAWT